MIRKFILIFGSILFLTTSFGEEEKTNKTTVKTTAAPYANYWDAEAWEEGSNDSFWRAKSDSSRQIAPKRAIVSNKESKVWHRSK